MSTSFNDLVCSFTLERHFDDLGIQTVLGTATHPTLGEVATLSAFLIYRGMDGDFLVMMDEESQELHELSVALFDRNGHLKPCFKTGYRSGTGCWGDELNRDALAYIDDITVQEEYRRQGVGSQLLQGLLKSEYGKLEISNIVCLPSTEDGAVAKAFVIKNGFRRIGRTQFFGYSMDPEHPSHRILASDDVQQSLREAFPLPPEPSYREMLASGQDPEEISNNIKRERQQKFPIHCAILSDKSESVAQVICHAHQADPKSLYAPDEVGFLPMHVAVQAKNMIAFNTLLELGRVEDLQNHHNADGATPLEVLQDGMMSARELMETLLSVSTVSLPGNVDADYLSMEYVVKTAMGLDTGCATVQDYIAQGNHGCTCGHCRGGWLSPRMSLQLEVQAASSMDSMPGEGEYTFGERQAIPASEIDFVFHGKFIPPSLYGKKFYLSFYHGFTAVFRAAYDILKHASGPFTAETVLAHARRAYSDETTYFFSHGGKVEYALDAITSFAKDQSILGDREFFRTFGNRFVALPMCANDEKFELVRRMVGLDPEQRWAPYRRPEGDEDMDEDEDDSDNEALEGDA